MRETMPGVPDLSDIYVAAPAEAEVSVSIYCDMCGQQLEGAWACVEVLQILEKAVEHRLTHMEGPS